MIPSLKSFRTEALSARTLVIKVGSRILTAEDSTTPHVKRVRSLVDGIAALRQSGRRVLLVSSGAIAHGMKSMGLSKRPATIPAKQACASIGQIRLMNMYESCFSKHGILIGQVLITWDDLRDKKRYLNLRNTLFQLFDLNAVPIINENDSVGIEEIRFGENDTLAAQLSLLVEADLFVNLTDINGLYDADPKTEKNARQIPLVAQFSPALHKLASENKNEVSVGGMSTKLKAAEMVTRAGLHALIGDGFHRSLLDVLSDPSAGTIFLPSEKKIPSRHRWIAFTGRPSGSIIVDQGAATAITEKGKSLLPAGVKSITGTFKVGDMVDIQSDRSMTIGRGLVNYSSGDAIRIAGCKTSDIASRLGSKTFDELIHRDNLVVL
jgi:glutamate 5-kinase